MVGYRGQKGLLSLACFIVLLMVSLPASAESTANPLSDPVDFLYDANLSGGVDGVGWDAKTQLVGGTGDLGLEAYTWHDNSLVDSVNRWVYGEDLNAWWGSEPTRHRWILGDIQLSQCDCVQRYGRNSLERW